MERYTLGQFLSDVVSEVRLLKQNATSEEIGRLDLKTFDSGDFTGCIYGQMTGDCRSDRASELIFSCCQRFVRNDMCGKIEEGGFSVVATQVNGKAIEGVASAPELKTHRGENIVHFSAIETYILLPSSKPKKIISYLKGEIDSLDL